MITKRTTISDATATSASLSATVSELARGGGGLRTIVLEGQTFVLSLIPADPGHSAPEPAGTNTVAALEMELLMSGDQGQLSILSRADMLSLNAASALSGIPVRTLTHMRQTNRVLALARAGAQKGYRFPAFQFEPTVLTAIPAVLAAFGPNRAWQAFDFLTHTEPLLSGAVPVTLLQTGEAVEVERVLCAAGNLIHGAH